MPCKHYPTIGCATLEVGIFSMFVPDRGAIKFLYHSACQCSVIGVDLLEEPQSWAVVSTMDDRRTWSRLVFSYMKSLGCGGPQEN